MRYAAILAALAAIPAQADLGDQLFKLLPADGAQDDYFGFPVGISGDIAIVGKYGDDQNGSRAGAAYLFDVNTGEQIFKILSDDGAQDDHFGISVAIDGNLAIVGAHSDDIIGPRSGSAYIFDVSTGEQLLKLWPKDAWIEEYFGSRVAISGNIAVISATGDDENGEQSGSAYLFDATTGVELFKLLPDDGQAYDRFGTSLAISADVAVVGATGDATRGRPTGVVYVFDVTTGEQLHKLLPEIGNEEDRFGQSVAISGDTIIVGAIGDGELGNDDGAAYLFDATTGEQLARLLADDAAQQDHFGIAVAIDAGTAVIGADLNDDNGRNSGSAYLFDADRCRADVDDDGDLDAEDFFAYLDLFAAGDDAADIDGDGDIDAEDFFGYLDLFALGC